MFKLNKMINSILNYFDNKQRKIDKYLSIENSIEEKKQEALELTKAYNIYKEECEQLIKSCDLNDGDSNKKHVEQRFNKYFENYINQLGEIKKSADEFIGKKNILVARNSWLKEEIEKGEKEIKQSMKHPDKLGEGAKKRKKLSSKKDKFHAVMGEFKRGTLHSSDGKKVTNRDQAIAIAYSESGINKSETERAMVTIVNGKNLIDDYEIIKGELQEFVEIFEQYPIEKAEEVKGGLADNKTLKDIAKKHKVKVEHLEGQMKMGMKVEMEHTNDKSKAEEIAKDHLVEDPDYYTKLAEMESEKAEEDMLQKAEEARILLEKVYPDAVEKIREALKYKKSDNMTAKEPEELKEQKKYADAIVWNSEGKMLFLMRSKNSEMFPGVLSLPGGHINQNEQPKDAVIRELKEETGLDGENPRKLAIAKNPEINYFEVTVKEPYEVVLVEDEHINYEWLSLDELEDKQLIANLGENLKKIYKIGYDVRKL